MGLIFDNDLIQVSGQVINSQPENDDLCSSGILFIEFEDQDRTEYHLTMIARGPDARQAMQRVLKQAEQ